MDNALLWCGMQFLNLKYKNGVNVNGKEQNTSFCDQQKDAYELFTTKRGFGDAQLD